jgi:alkylation response protein AidB-like acyl-CoA dehydrogenase
MTEFRADLRDIRFAIFEHIGTSALTSSGRFDGQSDEEYEMILREADKLCREVLNPLNASGDEEGCTFKDGQVTAPRGFKAAYKQFAEGGWIGMSMPAEHDGMGLPHVVGIAATELFTAANPAFMMAPGLTVAAARMMAAVGTPDLHQRYLPHMVNGKWAGTMCLTEPGAGSALGDIRSMATPLGDGQYKVKGTKIFISFGHHDLTENIVHLVLARTPGAPPGTKGLSLFVVPLHRVDDDGNCLEFNDVRCAGIEEKMGIHGSPTCQMVFGDDDDCIGTIVGKEGDGLRHMFHMMNEARVAVGVQGSATANLAYLTALAYAKERVQGSSVKQFKNPDAPRVTIIEHPNVRQMLMETRALAEGTRGLVFRAAWYGDMAEIATDDKDKAKYHGLEEILTPIVKAYCSEAGFRATDVAMQIHGGYGYIREYGVEQFMRDVKIASIYEGTNSIQAIDLLARKVARAGGRDFMAVLGEIDRFTKAHAEHPTLGKAVANLVAARNALAEATMGLGKYSFAGDLEYPIMQAKPYLTMFGHTLVGWTLLDQAALAYDKAQAIRAEAPNATPADHSELRFYEDKGHTARWFAAQVLPSVRGIGKAIGSEDRSALDASF